MFIIRYIQLLPFKIITEMVPWSLSYSEWSFAFQKWYINRIFVLQNYINVS